MTSAAVHIDLRHEQQNPPALPKQKHLIRGGRVVERDPLTITGIVIHQAACVFGVTPRDVRLASGDRRLATARRSLGVACHALAFDGYFATPNPLRWFVWHGNALNAHTLGLEVQGRYPGLLDDPRTAPNEAVRTTWGGAPQSLAQDTLDAAKAALAWLIAEGRREGMFLRREPVLYAHRQSSDTRRSDPGQAIWQSLVLDYAVPVLGCVTDPKFTVGDGRPVPIEWDPAGVGRY